MRVKKHLPLESVALRRRAEQKWQADPKRTDATLSAENVQKQLYELQIYQIELEMQNEELRSVQADLARVAARFGDLYDFAPVGYVTLDRTGTITQTNLSAAMLLGTPRGQLPGKRFGRFVALVDLPVFNIFLRQAFAAEASQRCEVALTANGGSCSVRIEATRSGDGAECRAVIMDITERKQAEQMLLKSEEHFRSMAEAVPLVLYNYVLNPDGSNYFSYMNHRSKEVCGVDAEEIIADSNKFWSLVHVDDRQRLREEDVKANKAGTGLITEHRIVTPSGELKWLHVESTPSPAPTGEPATWSGFILDITERKHAEDQILHMAQHDALTGLANRSLFTDRLQRAIANALRDKTNLALLFIDLDKFKPVNDQFGHAVGDLLLQDVARRVLSCVRDSDTLARIGGDEFLVLLRDVAGEPEALAVAEEIRASLEQPFVLAQHSLEISCCVGVALYPQHGDDDLTLATHADQAMYQAKERGRNQVRLYHP